jgi:hypothetical protein
VYLVFGRESLFPYQNHLFVMTKLEKEQARGLERPSRWQGVKKWLMSHKIETTAILVCLLGTAAILAIVYVPSDEAPSPTSVVNTPNTGDSESTPNNGDVGGTDAPSGNEEESDDIVGDVPPPAPSTDAIMDSPIFQKLLLLTDLQDTSSPQYKAADWLIALDFLKLGAEAPNLHQRFALATFYMATGGGLAIKNGWTRCSAVPPPTENDNNEAASNIQCMVHNGNVICAERGNFETCDFTDDSGTMSQGNRFLSPVNECEWFGITCDDSGVVTRIDIENNELSGFLPSELALLTSLRTLNISNNTVGGSIPEELSLIGNMDQLLLTSNKLEGEIPVDIYDLQGLTRLEIERNNLEGPLLPEVRNWELLEVMYINHNKLSGELPSELGTLGNLRKATLNNNFFSGPIPTDLGNLVNLESIKFAQNNFTGAVPSSLCDIRIRSVTADCLLNPNTNETEVSCSCCTRCCADDGNICQDV